MSTSRKRQHPPSIESLDMAYSAYNNTYTSNHNDNQLSSAAASSSSSRLPPTPANRPSRKRSRVDNYDVDPEPDLELEPERMDIDAYGADGNGSRGSSSGSSSRNRDDATFEPGMMMNGGGNGNGKGKSSGSGSHSKSTKGTKRKVAAKSNTNIDTSTYPSPSDSTYSHHHQQQTNHPHTSNPISVTSVSVSKSTKPKTKPSTSSSNPGPGGSSGGGGGGGGGPNLTREARRKQNHSMIERRRREKMNKAFQDLRGMVPGLSETEQKGEFKLEVLERTVEHMRELKAIIARISDLPAGTNIDLGTLACERCREEEERGGRRVGKGGLMRMRGVKEEDGDEDGEDEDGDEDGDGDGDEEEEMEDEVEERKIIETSKSTRSPRKQEINRTRDNDRKRHRDKQEAEGEEDETDAVTDNDHNHPQLQNSGTRESPGSSRMPSISPMTESFPLIDRKPFSSGPGGFRSPIPATNGQFLREMSPRWSGNAMGNGISNQPRSRGSTMSPFPGQTRAFPSTPNSQHAHSLSHSHVIQQQQMQQHDHRHAQHQLQANHPHHHSPSSKSMTRSDSQATVPEDHLPLHGSIHPSFPQQPSAILAQAASPGGQGQNQAQPQGAPNLESNSPGSTPLSRFFNPNNLPQGYSDTSLPAFRNSQNPSLYLPPPINTNPSPVSPFFTTDLSGRYPIEPSPMLPPLPGMHSLFGDIPVLHRMDSKSDLSITMSINERDVIRISPDETAQTPNQSALTNSSAATRSSLGKEEEEAANVLLAFSSPETMTPFQPASNTALSLERWSLDYSGSRRNSLSSITNGNGYGYKKEGLLPSPDLARDDVEMTRTSSGIVVGSGGGGGGIKTAKTARDILQMAGQVVKRDIDMM